MTKRRHTSVNAPAPSSRRPWGLAGAVLALLVYGGMVVSEPGRAVTPPAKGPAVRRVLPVATAMAAAPSGIFHSGSASWYGRELQGSPTASGEPFDMYALTAAHRTLPFGTRVRVVNLSNDRAVEVVINDRGPHARRRMIDLSYAAADEIRMVGAGTARVEVEPVDR